MIDERLRELVRLRMQQAGATLREARILGAEHTGRGAVNRAYYAMFYAVQEADKFIRNSRSYMEAKGFLSPD